MVDSLLKIGVQCVEVGMYVEKLDRPWQQTPFPIRGFYIRDLYEIKQLQIYCQYVLVNPHKGVAPAHSSSSSVPVKNRDRYVVSPLKINPSAYVTSVPLHEEMTKAKAVYDQLSDELALTMSLVKTKKWNSVSRLLELCEGMVKSIIRHPDAFMWLVRVHKMNKKPYYYLLRTASWAVLFARHLGLPKSDMQALAISLLLKDVGQLHLPAAVITKAKQGAEISMIDPGVGQLIIHRTIKILVNFPEIPAKVIKAIRMHYERFNGDGFPMKLQGDQIFLLSRIMGIATFYDEASYVKERKCAILISQAVSCLYKVRGSQFQDELVTEFIKAIGLYPTGTLVKLTTKEIAVVIEQNYQRRLKPRVMLALDSRGQEYEEYKVVDLFEHHQHTSAFKEKYSIPIQTIEIMQDVEPYGYPVKVHKIRNSHINNISSSNNNINIDNVIHNILNTNSNNNNNDNNTGRRKKDLRPLFS